MTAAVLAAAALTGCAGLDMPEQDADSWTHARIAEAGPAAAPVYVPERRMTREDMAGLSRGALSVLERGAQVRAAAAGVRDPEEDAETYAARQLARATPPQ
ncbi:hypothetical protein F1654_12090 [Alkalicaulis satelles]|uniref:Uncharacterized protein n=1 Tax=Alkalicaulis satelles TaxID=2609175 RepID=A0A5M6ZEV0_9PROT|nr:hypothetical protein [Alkalicaulis satelles]KAA5801628.1 hypothetical protein F1654_12090 [Alkalicaulis satelles]